MLWKIFTNNVLENSCKNNIKRGRCRMTNFEKYKRDILRIAAESDSSLAMKDGAVVACGDLDCKECDFNNGGNCRKNQFNWLCEDDGEEPDGCDSCKYEYKAEDESPCTECSSNYTSKWERKPKKTRQDEFLEHYPNAMRNKSTDAIMVCPKDISGEIPYNSGRGCDVTCIECCQDYWLQEVEE